MNEPVGATTDEPVPASVDQPIAELVNQPVNKPVNRRKKTVILERECTATTVPYGDQVTLDAGGEVQIVQQLGGSITVKTEFGVLMRIDGADADALGLEPPEQSAAVLGDSSTGDAADFTIDRVTDALRTVYDPEIPVSIIDLGLVYRTEEFFDDDGARRIEVDMTMTAPGCGMGDILCADARRAVAAVPGVDEVLVTLVYEPRWTVHHMSEATRLELGLL